MEVSGQLHDPAALPLGKEPPVPIGQAAGWPQSRPGSYGEEKTLVATRNQTPTAQPIARRYIPQASALHNYPTTVTKTNCLTLFAKTI
jgi:hypothetical protein